MPRYSPRTHVFNYGGIADTSKRERHVLSEFCKRMKRAHGASYKAVRDPVTHGLVIEVDGATVDGVLQTRAGPVAVELLGYSPLRDRGDVLNRDETLRKYVKRRLFDQLNTLAYSLRLEYRTRKRPGPGSAGMIKTVPVMDVNDQLLVELRRLLRRAEVDRSQEFLSIHFFGPERNRIFGRRDDRLNLDQTDFPCCGAHFERIRVQAISPDSTPRVESDLSGGGIGLDEAWVRKHVASKAERSLKQSVQRANGLPVWLIVHSDGYAIHQTIHERHRRKAVELCRSVLQNTTHAFARVYWADRTGTLGGAWVGRVL
jgi:hypothetical protein